MGTQLHTPSIPDADTLGWSHTNVVVSGRYAHLLRPIHSKICFRWLRGVLYTCVSGLLTNNSMLPASMFYILTRSALTAHARRGSDNAVSTRLYGTYFAEEHTFFKPEQSVYTNSIDLLILQEGLRYLSFEL